MKNLITIFALLFLSTLYSQDRPYGMVEIKNFNDSIDFSKPVTTFRDITVTQYNQAGVDFFTIENFRQNNYSLNIIRVRREDQNKVNEEYEKTSTFDPNKSLQEILKKDKK